MSLKVSDTIDLTNGVGRVALFPVGVRVRSLTVVQCPTGVSVFLQIGGGLPFPVALQWVLTDLTDADADAGIYLTSAPVAGVFQAVAGADD